MNLGRTRSSIGEDNSFPFSMISTIRSIRRSFCNGAPNYEEAVITEKSKKIPMVCTNLIPLNILKALYMETTGTMHLFSRKSSSFAPTYPSTPPHPDILPSLSSYYFSVVVTLLKLDVCFETFGVPK